MAEQLLNDDVVPNNVETISTTLSDTGATLITQPIPSMMQVVRPLPDQTPDKMLTRLMELDTFTWTVGASPTLTTPLQTYDPFVALANLPSLSDIIQWYQYIRSDLEVHVRLNTNQFYAGALMFSAIPGLPSAAVATMQQRSWLSHWIISAQKQDTLVIKLPWSWPTRFINVSDVLDSMSALIMWSVFADINASLYATVTAPQNITCTLFARFVNPVLMFPWDGATTARKVRQAAKASQAQRVRVVQQSGQVTAPTIRSKKGSRSVVHVSRNTSDPVQSTSGSALGSMSLPGSVMSPISEIGDIFDSVVSVAQPIMSLVQDFAGLLDKPEIDQPVTRVYPVTTANACQVDIPDQSLPLSLYRGSYLNVDATAIPGGRNWTVLDVASTPALGFAFTFTNTSPNNTTAMPFMAPGTPLYAMAMTHAYFRGSVRMHVKFFASSFISARVLFVLAPNTSTTSDVIANNLTRVVDVKGDTTIEWTIPWMYPVDFGQCYAGETSPTSLIDEIYTIQASILTDITTNDVSVAPQVDMRVWYAAGPDAQWSSPIAVPIKIAYSYPNAPSMIKEGQRRVLKERLARRRVAGAIEFPLAAPARAATRRDLLLQVGHFTLVPKSQASIQDAFKVTFQPFVMDCTQLTDSHHCTSETSTYVTDLLKRYQQTNPDTTTFTDLVTFPGTYSPSQGTLGYFFNRMFLFCRGGVRYKNTVPANTWMNASWGTPDLTIDSTWAGLPQGNATLQYIDQTSLEFSFSNPWIAQVPFTSGGGSQTGIFNPILNFGSWLPQGCVVRGTLGAYGNSQWSTAVRDDYLLGFLVAPDWTT
jgi:hypothetical protein